MKPVIEIIDQGKDFKIYYMYQELKGLGVYERTKAIERFINNATKTLETLISSDLREFLRGYGIIPYDGSEKSLEMAFSQLRQKGKEVSIIDRYFKLYDERIIAESPNHMTIVMENQDLIGCSMEVRIEKANENN